VGEQLGRDYTADGGTYIDGTCYDPQPEVGDVDIVDQERDGEVRDGALDSGKGEESGRETRERTRVEPVSPAHVTLNRTTFEDIIEHSCTTTYIA
jgi:hypothetical protein